MIMSKRLKAIIYMIIASILFTTLNLFGKLSNEISLYMKAFISNITALIIISTVIIKNKISFFGKKANLKYLLLRGICGALASFSLFYTLDHLILSDSTLLSKLSPFFATIFGFIVLKDKAEKRQIIFLLIIFVGALLVIKPDFSIEILPAFIGLLGAAFAGLAFSMIRKIGNKESNFTIIFYNIFISILTSIPFIISEKNILLYPSNIVYMILGGLCISFGQIFLTLAYKNTPACNIAMYDYLGLLISAIYGFFIFNEYPDYLSILGYIIILSVSLISFLLQKN